MIAIDSSALAKYLLREEGWPEVRKHLEEGCVTLDLALKEVFNAAWKRVVTGGLEANYAKEALEAFLNSGVVRIESEVQFLGEAFSLAVRKKITIYDALFIALAKSKGLALLTSDDGQSRAAAEEGVETILSGRGRTKGEKTK